MTMLEVCFVRDGAELDKVIRIRSFPGERSSSIIDSWSEEAGGKLRNQIREFTLWK